MANLENFSDDEKLIAFLVISKWAMLSEIERLTGVHVSTINKSLTGSIFQQFQDIDEHEIKIAIENARNTYKTGIEQNLDALNRANN